MLVKDTKLTYSKDLSIKLNIKCIPVHNYEPGIEMKEKWRISRQWGFIVKDEEKRKEVMR